MVRDGAASVGWKLGLRKWRRVGWGGTKGGATTLGLEEPVLPRTQGKGFLGWGSGIGQETDRRRSRGKAEPGLGPQRVSDCSP